MYVLCQFVNHYWWPVHAAIHLSGNKRFSAVGSMNGEVWQSYLSIEA